MKALLPRAAPVFALTALVALVACASRPETTTPAQQAETPPRSVAPPVAGATPHELAATPLPAPVTAPLTAPAPPPARMAATTPRPAPRPPRDIRTRNAVFKFASFDELPGWQQDDVRASWSAFRNSCEVLRKRDAWRDICAEAGTVLPSTRAMRGFFESRFTLLRILNTDRSPEGDVTGYFEPLLEGQYQRDGEFSTPVLGVPHDLYTLDWLRVPKAQRHAVVRVRPEGRLLLPARAGDTGTYAIDLRRFDLDDRDRRLRVRLVGTAGTPGARVEPYYTRAELEALGLPQGLDAPVVVWVNDPLALYAMQVQGSGRVRLPDGKILRLQYAEQNGHPFKPLRVVPRRSVAMATRGAGDGADPPDTFVLEGDDDQAAAPDDGVLTRGGRVARPREATPTAAESDPLVEELLKGAHKAAKPRPARPAPAPRTSPAATAAQAAIASRLASDPSYVFFKAVADRPLSEGPHGALGVPLTPGRSVAVDPRVTPLGYPVFLSAPAPAGSSISMQRLVFAQDTGGAIRGAVRADYFWGFGREAGQMARSTRHRGEMWVMLPSAEARQLASRKLLTRGVSLPGEAEGSCLVPDGEFCAEADE
ncbi:MAG: MltA domain-containing protein [Rhizobacter sp.]|nr:MltA domain-containing protein [Rhizobacter sp.]